MRIYLDHNATSPLRDEVREAVFRALRDLPGNPSSPHGEGAAARRAVEEAREQVASLVDADPAEVVFTSGASEANNAALGGALAPGAGALLAVGQADHVSVLEPAARQRSRGVAGALLPVAADGLLESEAFEAALERGPAVVSILWANNETGVVQPVEALVQRARARDARVHVDATQALGRMPVSFAGLGLDALSASAHKLGGPQGVGCLVVRRGREGEAWLRGGPQERGRRGGTENVAGIVGFGVACSLAAREGAARSRREGALRDRLWEGLRAKVPGLRRNGHPEHVLPNTLNVEIPGAPGEALVQALDLEGVAASNGAACHSGSIEPSHVLLAMGLSAAQARSSLRFSLGPGIDEAAIDRTIALVADLALRARAAGEA